MLRQESRNSTATPNSAANDHWLPSFTSERGGATLGRECKLAGASSGHLTWRHRDGAVGVRRERQQGAPYMPVAQPYAHGGAPRSPVSTMGSAGASEPPLGGAARPTAMQRLRSSGGSLSGLGRANRIAGKPTLASVGLWPRAARKRLGQS